MPHPSSSFVLLSCLMSRSLILTVTSSTLISILLYKWTTRGNSNDDDDFYSDDDDDDDNNSSVVPTAQRYRSVISIFFSSKLYKFLNTKLFTLPQPLYRSLTLVSVYHLCCLTFRTVALATLYSVTGSFPVRQLVPSAVKAVLAPLELSRSLLATPKVTFTSTLESFKVTVQRGQGTFQDSNVEGHRVRCFINTKSNPGWDDYLKEEDEAEEDEEDEEDEEMEDDTFDEGSTHTARIVTSQRHMRMASGLTWKCELCGERTPMNRIECPTCGTDRPSLVPQKGEMEEATPTKTQEDDEKAAKERRRKRQQRRNRRRRRRLEMGSRQDDSSSSTSTSTSSSSSSSSSDIDGNIETCGGYAIVDFVLSCPQHVTSMDVGRLFGSIMTIFAAAEKFSDDRVKKCTATPSMNEIDKCHEIRVQFAVSGLSSPSFERMLSHALNMIHSLSLEEIELETSIRTDVIRSITCNSPMLPGDLIAIDHVVDGLKVKISSDRTSTEDVSTHSSDQMTWRRTMILLFGTIPCVAACEIIKSNFRWPRAVNTVRYVYELFDDILEFIREKETTKRGLDIVKQQWLKMKPMVENIRHITIQTKYGTIGLEIE